MINKRSYRGFLVIVIGLSVYLSSVNVISASFSSDTAITSSGYSGSSSGGINHPASMPKTNNADLRDRKLDKEVGSWALARVATQLNVTTDYKKVLASIPWDPQRGASMYDLSEAAKKLGLKAYARHLTYDLLVQWRKPLIIYFPNHIAVLTALDKDQGILTFEEFSKNTYTMSKDTFLKEWEGYALEIRK